MSDIELILTLPACSAASLRGDPAPVRGAFATSDPAGRQLGSGGGTVNALLDAWRNAGSPDWGKWLESSRKLMIHGSGQSRRLPGYAVEGKPMLPLPLFPTLAAQRPDQTLFDLQTATYGSILRNSRRQYVLSIACGDVLLSCDAPLPACPDADVLIVGIPTTPEEASRHGVLVCPNGDHSRLDSFLQKPSPDLVASLSSSNSIFLDTGVWLFSRRAVDALLRCSGLDPENPEGEAGAFELFDSFATALGRNPTRADAVISGLKPAVLPLSSAYFHHFGTNRSVLASVERIAESPESRHGYGDGVERGAPVVLGSTVDQASIAGAKDVWIDASAIPATWKLAGRNVLTGIPSNDWTIALPDGACVDAVPLSGGRGTCWRAYGFDDPFRGKAGDPATLWQGRPLAGWFAKRGIDPASAGIDPAADIHDAPLHPAIDPDDPRCGSLLAWIVAEEPERDDALRDLWASLPRFSSSVLLSLGDPSARRAARKDMARRASEATDAAGWARQCLRTDLATAAELVKAGEIAEPPAIDGAGLAAAHDAMFRARLGTARPQDAITRLSELIVSRMALKPAVPRRDVLDDQIVWGRSPARIDLAGGWTDTPPYCLEHGGHVVNVALNLNGQPPIQAFARVIAEPKIVLRSIDLGSRAEITTLDELVAPPHLGDDFGIPRMVLRLAGFDPRFSGASGRRDLRRFLESTFGGGVELTILAAIPKGSGLGTSSIIAANALGTISSLCGLGWTFDDIFARTLSLEQLLTSGGGWQDQVGGVASGVKSIASEPGIAQRLTLRWLPPKLLEDAIADRRLSVYYTGITRVAHDILGEIVQNIFLNDPLCISCIDEISLNADFAVDALQRQDWESLCEAVRRSWALNRRIDSGTNPPAVQDILDRVAPWTAAAKLAGAGGGGYLLMLSPDPESGMRLRAELERNPPNGRARFVEPSISATGFQVTRS